MSDAQDLNQEVKAWAKMVRSKARRKLQQVTDKRTKTTQLKTKLHRTGGEVERVAFNMPRHLVFMRKGVGRKWPMSRQERSSNGARQPKPFLNPVIEDNVKELADKVQQNRADMATKNIKIK